MPRRSFASLVLLLSLVSFTGCLRAKQAQNNGPVEERTLVFYGLFDSEEVYAPAIQAFEASHRGVDVVYKKFTNPEQYLDLIINEIAEGEGPDVFLMHNSWLPKHYKKLTPAPVDAVDPVVFESLFVDVTSKDLIIPDKEGKRQVWGLPLYVDTLALYYNDEHFEDALPQQGHPSVTWEGIQNDVVALNREDQSFARFERSGVALGRADNILRAFDILMSMMLQYKAEFYNKDLTKVTFANDTAAEMALEMYVSFGLPSQKNYSWNKYLADPESAEKELTAFATGKTSMIFGYSYTYSDISKEIARLRSIGEETIDLTDVKVQEIPQAFDPELSKQTREVYANYFAPVVSRTTPYPDLAWEFLAQLVDEDYLEEYHRQTHRPSALRNLINAQISEPIYGVFAAQVGYAESLPMVDAEQYEAIFLKGIEVMLEKTQTSDQVVDSMAKDIQLLIPLTGVKPTYVAPE